MIIKAKEITIRDFRANLSYILKAMETGSTYIVNGVLIAGTKHFKENKDE